MRFLIPILILLLIACEPVPEKDWESGLVKKDDIYEPAPAKEPAKAFCGDQTCQADENKCSCPDDCGICEGNVSTTTHWACVEDTCQITEKPNICGNGICERDELGSCSKDCPSCNDQDMCTRDLFNFKDQECKHETISPCCGDGICQSSESQSCLQDCGGDLDLSDYPKPFIKDDEFQAHIVVGTSGQDQSSLTLAVISLMNGLRDDYTDIKATYTTQAKLDSEMASITNRNVILLGSPCQNKFTKELMPYTNECDEAIPSSGSLIKLFKTGTDTYALAIMGEDGEDTRRAGKFLENRRSMSGYEELP